MQKQNGATRSLKGFEVGCQLGLGGIRHFVFKEEGWMVGWGVAGGEGWLGNGGQLEYQRGTNHGGGGSWLTGSRVPQDGMTPLHYAAKYGHGAIVGVLFAAGADKDAETEVSGWGRG